MKKLSGLISVCACAALIFTSCSKGPKIDTSKWIDNLEDGLTAAKDENKNILAFFSVDDQDGVSADLKQAVFNTDEFIKAQNKKYILVNLDYSNSLFEEAGKAEAENQENASALIEKIQRNMVAVNLYNVESSPAFFILSKEGYVICTLNITDEANTVEAVNSIIADADDSIKSFAELLKATEKGSKLDKVNAVEAVYDNCPAQFRTVLYPLSEKVIAIDPENESGKVGKHVLSVANSNAIKAYINQDPEAASAEFVKAAESKYLEADDKQGAYYTAGYLLAQSGSMNYDRMKELFTKSYDSAPDSEHAGQILQMIGFVEERIAESNTLPFQSDMTVEGTAPANGQ